MKTLPAQESKFDLHTPEAIDAIELTDEELEQATGSMFGFGFPGFGFGFGFPGFGFGFGGFGASFAGAGFFF